jgi:hypothetical protein
MVARKMPFESQAIRNLIDRGITAFEDVKGLNIGGPQSGRLARAYATMKFLASQTPNPTSDDLDQIKSIGANIANPQPTEFSDFQDMITGVRDTRRGKKGPWR